MLFWPEDGVRKAVSVLYTAVFEGEMVNSILNHGDQCSAELPSQKH